MPAKTRWRKRSDKGEAHFREQMQVVGEAHFREQMQVVWKRREVPAHVRKKFKCAIKEGRNRADWSRRCGFKNSCSSTRSQQDRSLKTVAAGCWSRRNKKKGRSSCSASYWRGSRLPRRLPDSSGSAARRPPAVCWRRGSANSKPMEPSDVRVARKTIRGPSAIIPPSKDSGLAIGMGALLQLWAHPLQHLLPHALRSRWQSKAQCPSFRVTEVAAFNAG